MTEEILNPGETEPQAPLEQTLPDDELEEEIEESPDEDSADEAEQPSDDVELEIDGERYVVPKKLEAAFLKNADYTQKTQELARQKSEYESAQQELAKRSADQAQFLEDVSEVRALDKSLKEYAAIDWNSLAQTDPNRALQLQIQYQQLREARGAKAAELDQRVSAHVAESAKLEAAATQKTIEALKAPDPAAGWPGFSEQHMAKIASAVKEYGVTDADLKRINSPVAIKLLNLAVLGAQSLKAARKVASPKTEAQPVTQIRGNRAQAAKDPNTMPIDDWVKWERQRMARKAAANR